MLQTMAHRRLGSSFSWSRSSGTAAGSSAAAAARRRRAPPSAAAAAANAAAAAAAAAQPPKTEERVDAALADWIRANGGAVDGAELVYTCDAATGALRGRQLRASKALKPGDRVIRVPRALQVRDDDDAGGDAKLAALMRRAPKAAGGAPDGRVAWQFKMALRLVAYRLEGAASSRAPYVASLPGVADGVPVPLVAMRMAPGDLEALQNPRLAADAAAQAHFSADFADSVLASLPGSPDADPFGGQRVDRDLLKWGLALAMSRSFGFRRSPGHGMVPLVDVSGGARLGMGLSGTPRGAPHVAVAASPAVCSPHRRQCSKSTTITSSFHPFVIRWPTTRLNRMPRSAPTTTAPST